MDDQKTNPKDKKLNDIDLRIIDLLRKDGRMSFSQMAKIIDVSSGTVRLHYKKMIENEVLQIAAITNPLLLGQSKMALIGIKVDGYRLKEIANEISAFEEITYLVISTGSYDLFAEVFCTDKDHLLDFLTHKLYKVKGVKESQTFMFLEIVKETYL